MIVLTERGRTTNASKQQNIVPAPILTDTCKLKSIKNPRPKLSNKENTTEIGAEYSSILIGKMYNKKSGGFSSIISSY